MWLAELLSHVEYRILIGQIFRLSLTLNEIEIFSWKNQHGRENAKFCGNLWSLAAYLYYLNWTIGYQLKNAMF